MDTPVIERFSALAESARVEVAFDPKSKTFDFYGGCSHYTQRDPYYVPLARCKTFPALVAWLCHLSEKVWFTPTVQRSFVELWSRTTGREVPWST